MVEKQIFEASLEKHENIDATGITIPFDVEKVFGAKRVPVKISINGAEHRSTIVRRDGKYCLVIPKIFREAAGVKAGEMFSVTLEKDTEKRLVEIPPDFAEALQKADLTETFAKISHTHQKEYVNSITEAKREETRVGRITKAIEKIRAKK